MTYPTDDHAAIDELHRIVRQQRAAFAQAPHPTVEERRAHLGALAGMLIAHRERIEDAMERDFGVHPKALTDLTEILGVAGQAMYVAERLDAWMTPEERDVDPQLYGSASARIVYEPKGVVGVISPWNLPFLLSLGPLVDVLAAGNRAVLKPSELAPTSAELLRELVAGTFAGDHVAVVCGGLDLAKEFTTVSWDHLLYTGSTAVGREVAAAAARNLVPVTLELGGKNPVIVAPGSVDATTVTQIVGTKLAKSGQVCIAPDYCYVPRDQMDRFVTLARDYMSTQLPGYAASPDCTGMIGNAHEQRARALLDEAAAAGARIIDLDDSVTGSGHTAGCIVVDPPAQTRLMREEIFAPILPLVPYDTLDEVVTDLRGRDIPLALYVFSPDREEAEWLLARTRSGGACVNTCAVHGVLPSLGFGGAGASGLGRHRGIEGFREFSHARGVVVRGEDDDLIAAMFPPYSGLAQTIVEAAFAGGQQA